MPDALSAVHGALLIRVAVARTGEHDHTGEPAGTELIAQPLGIGHVVGMLRPAHGRALRAVELQRVGKVGGHHIGSGGSAYQQPCSGVGTVDLGQLSLLPFDGQQPLARAHDRGLRARRPRFPVATLARQAAPCRARRAHPDRLRPRLRQLWSPSCGSSGRCGPARRRVAVAHPTAAADRALPWTAGWATTDWKQASSRAG